MHPLVIWFLFFLLLGLIGFSYINKIQYHWEYIKSRNHQFNEYSSFYDFWFSFDLKSGFSKMKYILEVLLPVIFFTNSDYKENKKIIIETIKYLVLLVFFVVSFVIFFKIFFM